MSKTLSKGENIVLPNDVNEVSFNGISGLAIITNRKSLNTNKIALSSIVNEADVVVQSHNLSRLEIQSNSNEVVASYTPPLQREEKAIILAKIYQRNGAWRIRIIDDGFKEGETALMKHYEMEQKIFTTNQVVERFNEFRQSEHGRQLEQGARTAAQEAARISRTVATGVSNAYSVAMGNSDVIAQRQFEQDAQHFKPLTLEKMQSVALKDAVPSVKNLHIGLGWKSKTGSGFIKGLLGGVKSVNVDLDLSVQLLSFGGEIIDTVYINKTRSDNLAVNHYGDAAQGGNGIQDNEVISVALENLPPQVGFIAITATSNKNHLFAGLETGYLRIVNQQAMLPLVQFELDVTQQKSGCLLGVLSRNQQNQWEFIALGDYDNARTIKEFESKILHWCKFIGQARGIVPRDTGSLLPNYNV